MLTSLGRIDVTWQDNSNVEAGYIIFRTATSEWGTSPSTETLAANTVSYIDQSVQLATEHCYRLRAFVKIANPSDNSIYTFYSEFSNTACVTTPPPSAPPVSAYVVRAWPTSSSKVALNVRWTDTSAAPRFRIYRSTDSGATWGLANLTASFYGDFSEPWPAEQLVCYRVVAYNAAGDAEPSAAACTAPPATPTNLSATPVEGVQSTLTWRDNSSVEDGYLVYVYVTYGCEGSDAGVSHGEYVVAVLPPNTTTYTWGEDAGGSSGAGCWMYYEVEIVATRDGGRSDPSNRVSIS